MSVMINTFNIILQRKWSSNQQFPHFTYPFHVAAITRNKHSAHMRQMGNACKMLFGIPDGKRTRGRFRHDRRIKLKMGCKEQTMRMCTVFIRHRTRSSGWLLSMRQWTSGCHKRQKIWLGQLLLHSQELQSMLWSNNCNKHLIFICNTSRILCSF